MHLRWECPPCSFSSSTAEQSRAEQSSMEELWRSVWRGRGLEALGPFLGAASGPGAGTAGAGGGAGDAEEVDGDCNVGNSDDRAPRVVSRAWTCLADSSSGTRANAFEARSGHASLVDEENGCIWVFGGYSQGERCINSLCRFDLFSLSWEVVASPNAPSPRSSHSMCWNQDKSCFFVCHGSGRLFGSSNRGDCFQFHVASRTWTRFWPPTDAEAHSGEVYETWAPWVPHDLFGQIINAQPENGWFRLHFQGLPPHIDASSDRDENEDEDEDGQEDTEEDEEGEGDRGTPRAEPNELDQGSDVDNVAFDTQGRGALQAESSTRMHDEHGADDEEEWVYASHQERLNVVPPASYGGSLVCWKNALYLFGGTSGQVYHHEVFRFSLVRGQWSLLYTSGPKPAPRYKHESVIVGKLMYVVGGGTIVLGANTAIDVHVLDLETLTWAAMDVSDPKPCARIAFGFAQSPMNCDRFLLYGGRGSGARRLDDLWELNVASGTWSQLFIGPSGGIVESPVVSARAHFEQTASGPSATGSPTHTHERASSVQDAAHAAETVSEGDWPGARDFATLSTANDCVYLIGGNDGDHRHSRVHRLLMRFQPMSLTFACIRAIHRGLVLTSELNPEDVFRELGPDICAALSTLHPHALG